ncbi:hypothetical protein WK80_20530 [Burkholderia multivorans]|nr:hypothetical protein WK80_20530 [Burkholderia multivorans]OXH89835.1 hypothetical protein CA830_16930 [Burkholderia multivorans]OXH91131.1 hypothetical protein CA831_07835 [Burkholderia multivorans]
MAQWQGKIRDQGQPIRSKTFATSESAEQWASEQEAIQRALKQPHKVRQKPPMLTVGDLFERYIQALCRAAETSNGNVGYAAALSVMKRSYAPSQPRSSTSRI